MRSFYSFFATLTPLFFVACYRCRLSDGLRACTADFHPSGSDKPRVPMLPYP